MQDFLAKFMPPNASAHGPSLDAMNAIIHWLMAILFVGWGLYFLFVLFKFSARRNPKASYEGTRSHFSTYTEVAVAVIEIVLLVGFGIPAWASWVEPHDPAENPLVVRVVAQQSSEMVSLEQLGVQADRLGQVSPGRLILPHEPFVIGPVGLVSGVLRIRVKGSARVSLSVIQTA